jgi:predicted ATPase
MHKELEAQLIQTLQELEPSLERIGLGGAPSNEGRSTQIFVNLKDTSTRLPLGTLGDGMWRLLGMALAAQNAHNGLLLIDEVDTGLHYRTLEAMWRMLYQRAQTHNIQIIASTHSHDCVRSLSAIVQEGVTEHSQVMVHRLQRGQPQPVSYSEQAILFAAEHDLEVR